MTIKSAGIIGIDPDMKKSGVATVNFDGGIVDIKSMSVTELTKFISDNESCFFAIEDVNKHGAIYQHNRKGGRGVQSRIAQNVGMVKAAGSMICEIIEDATGRPPIMAPLGIGKQVKRNGKLFNQLTGWQGKSNEDTRDAACIGRWVASQLRDGWVIDNKAGQLVRPVK
ncbi:MAG: hypothetical protein Tp136SUR676911_10 [Prokaryotic dsDNA virus sp.]|jgi:hypothetical protein|nr:MAG: hypothetical protein Tp136SUR676911_10 [Prokaryotic dsDNA virus sp.]|tara:strand:+ start:8358 stop:8864 length:507 start_codon:yes stop_codon:yes gene_type:complete